MKTEKKTSGSVLNDVIWLMIMKMRLEIKNRSQTTT